MPIPFGLSGDAQEDYEASVDWYAARSKRSAIDFTNAANQAILTICNNPKRLPVKEYGLREFVMRKYPFSIVYLCVDDPEMIYVTSIWHHKRNPTNKYNK